jgi:hypothetical protein
VAVLKDSAPATAMRKPSDVFLELAETQSSRQTRTRGQHFAHHGRSAGGPIATACAHSLNDPTIRACIALYAPADMTFAWKYADPNDVLDSPRLLRQYLAGTPEDAPENYRSASAIDLAQPGGPSTLLVHGRRDVLVWELQSRRFAAHLARLSHTFRREAPREPCSGKEGADFGGGLCEHTLSAAKIKPDAANAWLPQAVADKCEIGGLSQQNIPHFFLDLPCATHALDYPWHGPSSSLLRPTLDAFLTHFLKTP